MKEFRRKGSLCSDGPDCLYAELLTHEERKVEELLEKTEDLKEKLERSVQDLTALKELHMNFVSEIHSIVETKRYWKTALQVMNKKELRHQNGLSSKKKKRE